MENQINVISKTKEYQQEIILRMEIVISEKMQSMQGKSVTFEDVIELDILQTISSHLIAVFELTTEEVPYEILGPWTMVKIHKELLSLYKLQSKVKDNKYMDLLDKIANKLFISLFTTH